MNLPTQYKCKHCGSAIPWQDLTHCEFVIIACVLGINLVKVFCKECTNERRKQRFIHK